MQQRKVKPLEGVVYLPKSENIVAVKLASSLYKLSLQIRERWHYRASLQEGKKKGLWELSRYFSLLSIAKKILTRILLNRLNEHIVPISCLTRAASQFGLSSKSRKLSA